MKILIRHKSNFYILLSALILILLNYIVGQILGTGLLLVVLMFFLTSMYTIQRSESTIYFLILCTVFQNIILILCASGMTRPETTLVILIKELVVYVSAFIFIIKNRLKTPKLVDILFFCYMLSAFFNVLLLSPVISAGIVGLRQTLVIFFSVYFGMAIRMSDDFAIERVLDYIVNAAIFVSIVGFVIYVCPFEMWDYLGYGDFWYNKTGANSYSGGNFYTYDLGIKLKRMVSIFADPLAYAHFIGIAFVILFVKYKKYNKIIKKIIITIALLLGLSKSSFLLLVCIILVSFYSKIKNIYLRAFFVSIIIMIAGLGIAVMSWYVSMLSANTSMGNHINSFFYGFTNASLFGTGFGTFGYNALMMGEDASVEGLESFFSTLMGQAGFVGCFLLYSFISIIILRFIKVYRNIKEPNVLIAMILLITVSIESFLSASSVSMLGTGLYFAIVGMVYKQYCK